jgi:hypothetical protein
LQHFNSQSKQNKQKKMVEALKTDNSVKTLKSSELNTQCPKKNRSVSLRPGDDFQSDKLRASSMRRKTFAKNDADKTQKSKVEKELTKVISSDGKMLHAAQHTSIDVHTDDEGERGTLLSNPHHHHHVHLPKFSLSPPDTKVSFCHWRTCQPLIINKSISF